ncbi:hypothetical protein [Holospora obtusa]|uniref:hypothetical protein n=1 Tax=Holospora obtusa TaxID=49893 RepID=UPI0003AEB0AA|nr:hypothetical protein [Holospora obtusa]
MNIALKDKIPELTHFYHYHCKRNGLNVLLKAEEKGNPQENKPFEDYPIDFVHIDIMRVLKRENVDWVTKTSI